MRLSDRWLAELENILRRSRLLPAAHRVRRVVKLFKEPAFQRQERLQHQRFRQFRRQHGVVLRHRVRGASESGRQALMLGLGLGVERRLGFLKGLELAGFKPNVLILDVRKAGILRAYHRLNANGRIDVFDEFMGSLDYRMAERALAACRSLEEVVAIERDGVRVGRIAVSTFLKWHRVGSVDLETPETRWRFVKLLARSMQAAAGAHRALKTIRPQLMWLVDGVYTPEAELFDACLAQGIDTIAWTSGHRSNTVIFKRYTRQTRDQHPKSLSAQTWRMVREMPWTDAHRERLSQELYGSYASGDWQSHVGTQVDKQLAEADEVRRQLGLDPAKKTAVIFPHILWDGSLSWGTDLFLGYEEWLIETVRAACRNDRINWVLKIHPANVGKSTKAGFTGEPSEVTALRRRIGSLPPHIIFVPAEHRLSTFSLYSVMDYCVTVRGTVGIEAARLGIPVLNGGTGRYSGKGFTLDPASQDAYLDRIAHLQDVPPLSATQRELAERFAYGTFIVRPLRLSSITSAWQLDEAKRHGSAQRAFQLHIASPEDWYTAPDLRAFADWVQSDATDFIAPEEPRGLRR